MSEVSEGIILILIAAFFQGTYALFLKFMNCWKWENFWTVFSFISLVISPVLLCSILVPNFIIILASSSVNTIAISFFCGILWGIGSVLFSLSIMRIGLALTYSLIIGLTASIGSLLPLLLDASLAPSVVLLFVLGILAMFIGLTFSAYAGMKREKLQKTKEFKIGLVLALISGLTSPMLNLGFVSGNSILKTAQALGISIFASLPIWIVVLLGGFVANFGYAAYLLIKAKSFHLFAQKTSTNLVFSAVSGVFFFSGLVIYGVASSIIEKLGSSIGWAVLMSLMIVISNLTSVIIGEWKNSRKALRYQVISISILVIGITIMSMSFYF